MNVLSFYEFRENIEHCKFAGILALAPSNVWTIFFTRRTKTIIHWMMQAFGGAFAIIGMAYEYTSRTSHFRSTHSKLGKPLANCRCFLSSPN